MKKTKMNLEELSVRSFSTNLSKEEVNTIQGGATAVQTTIPIIVSLVRVSILCPSSPAQQLATMMTVCQQSACFTVCQDPRTM